MKANELRINNIVLARGANALIKSIDETHVGYSKSKKGKWIKRETLTEERVPLKMIQGILLTEDWLLKFGFEEDLSQLDPPDTPNGNFWSEYEKEGVRIDMPFFEYNHDEINIEIKYVHQLQNLYYSLTGEELKLTK